MARPERLAIAVAVALLGACGAAPRATRPAGDAVLLIACATPDATVWVDEALVGEVRDVRGGILLDPGPHRVEVRHEQHYPRYLELDARAGERRRVTVDLVATPE